MVVTNPSSQDQQVRGAVARVLSWMFRGSRVCVGGVCRIAANPVRRRWQRHYHPARPHARTHLVIDLAFLAAILALVGVNAYVFFVRPRPAPSRVRLEWTAEPATVRAGDRIAFTLAYAHTGNEDLRDATLALRLPEHFTVEAVSPGTYDADAQTVLIGGIAAGSSGAITVRGFADAADGTTLRMEGTFHGQGATTAERTVAATTAEVRGVAITAALELAYDPLFAHAAYDTIVVLTSAVTRTWPPLVVTLEGTPGAPAELAALGKDSASDRVPFTFITGDAGDGKLRFRVERRATSGALEPFGMVELPFSATANPIAATIERVEGAGPVRLGDAFTVRVHRTIDPKRWPYFDTRAVFRLRIEGALAPQSKLAADSGNVVRGVTAWEFPIPNEPPASVVYTATVAVPPTADAATGDRFSYTITPEVHYMAPGGSSAPFARVAGTTLEVPVIGALRVAALARYFTPEGEQLGRGPLPPRVGRATKYWITWDARAFIEAADRVVVTAMLPAGVEWTGKTSTTAGEQLIYDPTTRAVTWAVGRVEQTTGNTLNAVTASFEVAFVPDAAQAGTFAPLLGATSARAVGATTGAALEDDAGAVTTELSGDAAARGKGRVIR